MLILTRKAGESLHIGDDIKVTVVEVKGPQIRIGVSAPREYRIFREEIYIQIQEENKQASQVDNLDFEGIGNWKGSKEEKGKKTPSRVGQLKGFKKKK